MFRGQTFFSPFYCTVLSSQMTGLANFYEKKKTNFSVSRGCLLLLIFVLKIISYYTLGRVYFSPLRKRFLPLPLK